MNWLIGSAFFDFLTGLIGYPVARLALPLLTFRKVRAQPLTSMEGGFNVFGYRYDSDGRIEIESTMAGFVGLVIFLILFFSLGILIRAAS
jgi:hypothetical protein